MRILTFRGATMQAAMARVRDEAGSDAIVLSTGNGIGGQYEISVAVEDEPAQPPRRRTAPGHRVAPRPHPGGNESTSVPGDLAAQLDRRLSLLENFVRLQVPVESEILRRLVASGIDPRVVKEIADACPPGDDERALDHVRTEIEKRVSIAPPIAFRPGTPTHVCIVGPSGAGKTTTLAKLAAHYAVREGLSVGIATQDSHRLGAVAQLEAFAKVLDIPVAAIVDPADTPTILSRFIGCDLVLVDTAGIASDTALAELRTTVEATRWDEVALVLPAVMSAADMEQAARRYEIFGPTRLVVTKLDEAALPGVVLHATTLGTPVGHLADGPDIPHDMHDATVSATVDAILGGLDHA